VFVWPFRRVARDISIERLRLEFEREKHRDELQLRLRELQLKEREAQRSTWHSPLFLAVIAALVGLFSNAVVAVLNGRLQRDLEQQKAEAARVIEALKTGDPDIAAENLQLLVDAKLIRESADDINRYLQTRLEGEGAQLPIEDSSDIRRPNREPIQLTTNPRFCDQYLKFGAPAAEKRFCRVGYAFGFDTKRRLATWVIYTVRSDRDAPPRQRTGTEDWYFDREISQESQAGADVYSQNEWDRGHLIFRPDATWNENLYNELWLYSVTAPQHEHLNRTEWSALERLPGEVVRAGRAPELFIFAGPVFGPMTTKAYRDLVDIPDGFYRMVYDPKNSRVAAWLVPNGPKPISIYPGAVGLNDPTDKYLVTVDEVERVTGLDFFDALPDEMEASLEAQRSLAWLR
jgi:endonuclease G, mitochondrial